MSSTSPPPGRAAPASAAERGPGARAELRLVLSPLASRPSAEEVEAIQAAVYAALGMGPRPLPASDDWRFSGRWWRAQPP